jgi:hypothetical protein
MSLRCVCVVTIEDLISGLSAERELKKLVATKSGVAKKTKGASSLKNSKGI